MLNSKFLKFLVAFCVVGVAVSACNRSTEVDASSVLTAQGGILQYVPADTPYVFATPEPMPQDVLDMLEPHLDAILASYKEIMGTAIGDMAAKLEQDPLGNDEAASILAVANGFGELMSSGSLSESGLSIKSRAALYGVGLLPVLRIELTDVDAFEAFITEIEETSGNSMSIATVDEQSYRYAGDDKGRLILAVIDNYVVVTIVPTALSDQQLSAVLGLTLPSQSIAAAGVLDTLAADYGYTPHALGLIDIQRIVSVFLDEQTGVNAEILSLMDYDNFALSDVCRDEIRAAAGVVPRFVAGYTEISVEKFRSNSVFEIRDDFAAGLASIAGAVPGLGSDHDGLFSFGMSMDLLAAREFYVARLDALEADPYECELFADFQGGVAKGREALNQPVPPIVYGFKGFLVVIDKIDGFDFASKQPPTEIDMRLIVAIDNAPGLLAMGTMFSPDLAALNLQPDGKPVKFVPPQFGAQYDSIYIAMTDNALGIAVGEDAQSGLAALLEAAPGDPLPIMSMHMDAKSYYGFIGDAMMAGKPSTSPDAEAEEISPEVQQAIADLMTEFGELLSRISVDVLFTERGLEIPTVVTLVE